MTGCEGRDWDPIGSAGFLSQLAGVAGGFVLAGIIVILTAPAIKGKRIQTLLLFCGAFFALSFDSYLYSIVAGETVCERAWSANMLASGVLSLGAVAIFCGIAWLLNTYVSDDDIGQRAMGMSAMMSVGTALVVVPLLAVTGNAYLEYVYQDQNPPWAGWAILAYALVVVLALVGLGFSWWVGWPLGYSPRRPEPEEATSLALIGPYGAIGYTIMATVAQGIIVNVPASYWNPAPSRWLPAVITVTSLLIPTAILFPFIVGLPRRHHVAKAAPVPDQRSGPETTSVAATGADDA